ncbi:MAG: Type 1 glutamine amidotransferase-like domain-containing protein [Prevotellaceae bacterium]|jgi:dipeptidase E|nr:Type 1 glutamine amidotransferase-like domain-containing protein [Prevotellaceae bacterium]
MKLFLSSYFAGVAKLFLEFTQQTCVGKKVVFIPTASIVEYVTFYVGANKRALTKLGMVINELEISTASPEEIKTKIEEADYLFVEGGNTFYLLQELKRTGTDKLIVEHINKGKVYIGVSAGSMIVAPDIEYVRLMDDPSVASGLKSFSALSVVNFCVVPHHNNFPFKKAAKRIIEEYSDTLDLRVIGNNQAVVVDGETIEILTINK